MGISSERRGESVRLPPRHVMSDKVAPVPANELERQACLSFPGYSFMSFAPLHLDTPLIQTAPDFSASGKPLWLKLDALQPSGSFKLRGVGRLCQHEVQNGA
ncbi:MAG: serine dehydratase, partial [Rhizobium sp.]